MSTKASSNVLGQIIKNIYWTSTTTSYIKIQSIFSTFIDIAEQRYVNCILSRAHNSWSRFWAPQLIMLPEGHNYFVLTMAVSRKLIDFFFVKKIFIKKIFYSNWYNYGFHPWLLLNTSHVIYSNLSLNENLKKICYLSRACKKAIFLRL